MIAHKGNILLKLLNKIIFEKRKHLLSFHIIQRGFFFVFNFSIKTARNYSVKLHANFKLIYM